MWPKNSSLKVSVVDTNDTIKLVMQFLFGIIILLVILATYLKYSPKEFNEANVDKIEYVN
ncbi:hypothetical protein A9Q84_15705 [Halobacteriovorax marinus]|uniref:Uncharacterized protein n=1 Tax=Halobacteriovorax marinus TaxID=97084 RepID=A0A1Y5F487_9BACT|nr:hypothetical protein A9Q84_15705 [Halobacteriovorax marinus]